MSYSTVTYTTSADQAASKEFDITFSSEGGGFLNRGFILAGHIKVSIDDAEEIDFTVDTGVTPPTLTFGAGVTLNENDEVKIWRETPATVDGRLVDFTGGSSLRARDLDRAFTQNLFLVQENLDEIVFQATNPANLPLLTANNIVDLNFNNVNFTNIANIEGYDIGAALLKVDGMEEGATADQSDAEIATAYGNEVAQVSNDEKLAGTETGVRRFSPQDVAEMVTAHEATDAVSSVLGETGAVDFVNLGGLGGTQSGTESMIIYNSGTWYNITLDQLNNFFGGGGGTSDHGSLTGLSDDDHVQYLRVDGARSMTGPINMNSNQIQAAGAIFTNVGLQMTEGTDHGVSNPAGTGLLWVRSDTPSKLMFTDDTGGDYELTNPDAPDVNVVESVLGLTGVVDFTSLAALGAEPAAADQFIVYDADLTTWKTVTKTNLLSGIDSSWITDALETGLALTDGDCLGADAAGDLVRIPAGTSGQVLTSNGNAALATFQDAAGGAVEATQAEVKAASGTLAQYDWVAITGYDGADLTAADADADTPTVPPTGILIDSGVTTSVAGTVVTGGIVKGLNTSGFTAGQTLWLSQTAGDATASRPALDTIWKLGKVLVSHATNGVIHVEIEKVWNRIEVTGESYVQNDANFFGTGTASTVLPCDMTIEEVYCGNSISSASWHFGGVSHTASNHYTLTPRYTPAAGGSGLATAQTALASATSRTDLIGTGLCFEKNALGVDQNLDRNEGDRVFVTGTETGTVSMNAGTVVIWVVGHRRGN